MGVAGEASFLFGATRVAYLLILLAFLDWREVRAALIEMLSLGVTESFWLILVLGVRRGLGVVAVDVPTRTLLAKSDSALLITLFLFRLAVSYFATVGCLLEK